MRSWVNSSLIKLKKSCRGLSLPYSLYTAGAYYAKKLQGFLPAVWRVSQWAHAPWICTNDFNATRYFGEKSSWHSGRLDEAGHALVKQQLYPQKESKTNQMVASDQIYLILSNLSSTIFNNIKAILLLEPCFLLHQTSIFQASHRFMSFSKSNKERADSLTQKI